MSANDKNNPVLVYALGGLNEVGKNSYCIENDDNLILIDAGVRFPGEELPGVDYVIPDYTHLKNKGRKFKALLITHGHEDHIGGIPFLLKSISVPIIYAPRLAAALIRKKLGEFRIRENVSVIEYDKDSILKIGNFVVSFFTVTHSIPDSFGIVVDTPQGKIVTTGDFKIDLTPIGAEMELGKIAALGNGHIDLLMSDSTNAERDGYTPSEKNVLSSINEIFQSAPGRLIVSTFASNISRIQQIVQVAAERNKKVAIVGRSMEHVVSTSREFGYIKIPDSTLVSLEDLKNYKPEEIVILCTGSQGEPMAALSRIAKGDHPDIRIYPGDTVVFSSSPIPGNANSINKVVNSLTRSGANVLTNSILSEIHASGHPSKIELSMMLKLMKPKYFMPVHGEYRMLKQHRDLAITLGIPSDRIFVLDNGQSIQLLDHVVTRGEDFHSGNINIDGFDLNSLSDAVLIDRKILAADGMVSVLIVLDSSTSTILNEPHIYTKGFAKHINNQMLRDAELVLREKLDELMKSDFVNFNRIKDLVRTICRDYFKKKTGREPIIIPVIMNKIKEDTK